MHASWHDWQSRKHERNVKEEQDSWVEWLIPAALSGGIVSGPMKPPEKLTGLNLTEWHDFGCVVFDACSFPRNTSFNISERVRIDTRTAVCIL